MPEVLTKFNIMGQQQQLGFDFNTPPQDEKLVKEAAKVADVAKVEGDGNVEEVPEVSGVSKVAEVSKVATAAEASNVAAIDEVEKQGDIETVSASEVLATEVDAVEVGLTEGIAEEAAPGAIEIDEAVREVEFVVAKEKPSATKASPLTGKKSTRGRMRLRDMDVLVDLVDVPEDEILFQKHYYSIGDVSNMFKVNISLIRFWENEFDILKPKKNGKGDRLFRPQDIKNLQLIYHLLREKKYTIDGAKVFLKKNKKAEETFELIDALKKTKAFLLDLKANL